MTENNIMTMDAMLINYILEEFQNQNGHTFSTHQVSALAQKTFNFNF